MVDTRGAQLDRELHAAGHRKLTGVHPGAEVLGHTRREDAPGLVDAERAALAEDVDPLRVRRTGRKHLARHQLDVAGRVFRKLRRDHVSAQEGRLGG